MAQQTIDIGVAPNDGTGEPIRTAFLKCNQNFDELYNNLGSNIYNVLSYGADPDGVNDSATAINNAVLEAIAFAASGIGATVYIPDGKYVVRSRIVFDDASNITILGGDNVTITKTANDADFPYYSIFYFTGTVNNIKIKNIGLVNSVTQAVDQNEGCIYFRSATGNVLDLDNVTISDCKFSTPDCNMRGIQLLATLASSAVDNLTIKNCYFENIRNMGIEMLNQQAFATPKMRNIKVVDCFFTDTGSQPISICGGTNGILIRGNFFYECAGASIELVSTQNVVVDSNIHYSTIATCKFIITSTSWTVNCEEIVISNNRVHTVNPSPTGYSDHGLYIYQADKVVVTGNNIYSEINEFKDSHYCHITGNRFVTTGRNALKFSSASTHNYIADNYLDNYDAYGGSNTGTLYFLDAGTTANIAVNNVYRNTDTDDIIQTGGAVDNIFPAGDAVKYRATGEIVAATGIVKGKIADVIYYDGTAAIDITANPQIAASYNGRKITIVGSSDVNKLTLDDGDGLALAGGASMELGQYDTITLVYVSALSIWVELSRSNN